MRKILFLLVILPSMIFAQQSFNMTLLSNFDLPDLPSRFGAEYSDVWGYYDPETGTEVAILAGMEDIFFIDVTEPSSPEVIYTHHALNINGTTNGSLWRDFDTYQHYIYACADEGDSGVMVFDMSNVPSSISMVYQTNSFFSRSHTIFIDQENARLYAAGSNTQSNGLKILNLANPISPTLHASVPLNNVGGGYVHDVYVRDNIAYCSHGSLSKVQIYNFGFLPAFSIVGVIDNYPEAGYNHSGWLNEEGNLFVMCDETQGSDVKLVDVSDPLNISADDINTFFSELEGPSAPGASTAHNPYILGDLAYISYYHDGVQVFNISDPENITLVAYYDTYPENSGYGGYDGCWGVYPFFPSGIILGSDQNNGLFVMEIQDLTLGIEFLSFRASRKNEDVVLQWSVMDASFGNEFEVNRSADGGKTFETIGTVSLDQDKNDYSYTDNNVSNLSKYLYRIDFVQLDGKRINSSIRSITPDRSDSIVKIVNPVSSNLIVDVLQPIEELELKIFDMEGRMVWTHNEANPTAQIEMGIESVVPGHYVLTMKWPGSAENVLIEIVR